MSDSYKEAAKRHYRDAMYLLADRRLPNADQLFCFAGECGLKAIATQLGIGFNKIHFNVLWNQLALAAPSSITAGLQGLLQCSDAQSVTRWSIGERYLSDGDFDVNWEQDFVKRQKIVGGIMKEFDSVFLSGTP